MTTDFKMTNPTATGYYWVRESPGESVRPDYAPAGWEVMFWDAGGRAWWPVGLDYPVPSESIYDRETEMYAWVGPIAPPEAPR